MNIDIKFVTHKQLKETIKWRWLDRVDEESRVKFLKVMRDLYLEYKGYLEDKETETNEI